MYLTMTKPLFNSYFLFFLILTAFALSSCKKESDQPSWDVDILAPLISSSMTINNLVSDTLIKINPDSTVNLVYTSSLINYSADSLAQIRDTNLVSGFPIFSGTFPGGYQIVPLTPTVMNFQVSGVVLKKAILKTEFINIIMSNPIGCTLIFDYEVPGATLGGIPFRVFDSIPGNTRYSKTFSLAGYSLDLTGPGGTSSNTMSVSIVAYISKNVLKYTIPNTTALIDSNRIYNTQAEYVQGYLGQSTKNIGPQRSAFSLFKSIRSGILNFSKINITLDMDNSVGVDATINLLKISSINTKTGTTVNLICPSVINNSINVSRASQTGNPASPVDSTIKSVVINSSNSNISTQFFANLPNQLAYSLQVLVNPLGNISGDNDFIYSGHGINANLQVNIPLSALASNLVLADTLLLNLSNSKQIQKVNSGSLYLYLTNGLPFNAQVQIYTLNNINNKLTITDSLIQTPNNTILSANMAYIGNLWKVSSSVNSKLAIPLTKSKINNLVNAKKVIVLATFNTPAQNNFINIYSYYQLDFKLVADFNYNLSTKN